jgi:peptidoglycan-associated lipoprotein
LCGAACAREAQRDDWYGQWKPSPPPVAAAPAEETTPKETICQRDTDCGQGFLCLENRCTAITPGLAECSSGRVHFDYDDSTIRTEEYPTLQRIARCLQADQAMSIVIDGNTDERGTIEYNLALGDRRARAVASYLRDLGVSPDRIATVTYGKDRPVCTEHDEACWYKNRRAGLVAKR